MTLLGSRPSAPPASVLRRLDWVLLAAVLALIGVSSLLVYSATRPKQIAAGLAGAEV